MSDKASGQDLALVAVNEGEPAGETAKNDLAGAQGESEAPPKSYRVERRRKRRRRQHTADYESPGQKFRMALLIVVVLLIIVSLTNADNHWVQSAFAGWIARLKSLKGSLRLEIVLLSLAALVLIYLIVPDAGYRLRSAIGLNPGRGHRKK